MIVSCLCVTENRPAFLPWLLWNYDKQGHSRKELVIVDSSAEPSPWPHRADIKVVRCPEGSGVPQKRNLALEAATGDLVTWFDDDDWQHPQKLTILVSAVENGSPLAGSRRSWFVDLWRERCRPFEVHRGVIFNSAGFRRSTLKSIRFDEGRTKASDTSWMSAVQRNNRYEIKVVPETLSCWLCHSGNLSNPSSKYSFPRKLSEVANSVGTEHWCDTGDHLRELRNRLKG